MFDDLFITLKHEGYLSLCFDGSVCTAIKTGNLVLFKGRCQIKSKLLQVMRLLLGSSERTGDPANLTYGDSSVELTSRGHRMIGVGFYAPEASIPCTTAIQGTTVDIR